MEKQELTPAQVTEVLGNLPKALDRIDPTAREHTQAVISKRKRRLFLEKFAECGRIDIACDYAGCSRNLIAYARKKDPEFSKAYNDALESFLPALEAEAIRRGKDGVLKPVYHQGQVVGYERKFSDALLERVLEANDPRYQKKGGAAGGDINIKTGVIIIASGNGQTEQEWERQSVRVHQNQHAVIDVEAEPVALPAPSLEPPISTDAENVSFEDLL